MPSTMISSTVVWSTQSGSSWTGNILKDMAGQNWLFAGVEPRLTRGGAVLNSFDGRVVLTIPRDSAERLDHYSYGMALVL
jgi:hypothetical protein